MKHYLNVVIHILKKEQGKEKYHLLFAYIKIIIRANFYHKFLKHFNFNKNQNFNIQLLGFRIIFPSYPFLLVLFEEIFIEEIYNFESKSTVPVIVDCGSNIGLSVLYFKYKYPASRILAFEPDEKLYNILEQNVENNKLADVIIENYALAKENEERVFYGIANEEGSLNKSLVKTTKHNYAATIKTRKLSGYIENKTDLLKIDTEGAEGEIIKELCSTNKIELVDQIFLEYHTQCETSLNELTELLEKQKFKTSKVKPVSAGSPAQMISFYQKRTNEL